MDTYIVSGVLLLIYFQTTCSIETVYFNQACNTTGKSVSTSLRLEPSQYLWYSGSTSCFYNVVVPTGKLVLLRIGMFDLEPPSLGSCVDYINIHDGSDTTAALLNTSPLCDKLPDLPNTTFISTSNQMTIYLYSDLTAEGRGFDFIFSAVTTGSCSSSEFKCVNTDVCIDSSLTCNSIYECGDASDEAGCSYPEVKGISLNPNYALIVGLLLGIIGLGVLVVIVVLYVWRYNRWKIFARKPMTAKFELQPTTYQTAYPVTRLYYKDKYHNLYENPAVRKAEIIHKERKQEKLETTKQPEPPKVVTVPDEISPEEKGNSPTVQPSVNLGFEHETASQESAGEAPPNSPESPENFLPEAPVEENTLVMGNKAKQRGKKFENKFFEEERKSVTTKQRKTKTKLGKASRK